MKLIAVNLTLLRINYFKDYKLCESKICELQAEGNNLRQSITNEEIRISLLQKETMIKKEQLETLLQDKYKVIYLY